MKPSESLDCHRAEVRQIALRRGMHSVSVLGAVLKGFDTELSDSDLLVEPTAETSMLDRDGVLFKVPELLGIAVDVATPDALPTSFRQRVLNQAKPL